MVVTDSLQTFTCSLHFASIYKINNMKIVSIRIDHSFFCSNKILSFFPKNFCNSIGRWKLADKTLQKPSISKIFFSIFVINIFVYIRRTNQMELLFHQNQNIFLTFFIRFDKSKNNYVSFMLLSFCSFLIFPS